MEQVDLVDGMPRLPVKRAANRNKHGVKEIMMLCHEGNYGIAAMAGTMYKAWVM